MNKTLLLTFISILSISCTTYSDKISVTIKQPVLPVLTMKDANPVLKIELIRSQPIDYTLQSIAFALQGTTNIDDIENVGLYYAGPDGTLDIDKPAIASVAASETVTFSSVIPVETDTLTLWLSFRLKDRINLSHRFNVNCIGLETSEGKIKIPEATFSGLRAGVAVRQHMQDGHTYIPHSRTGHFSKRNLIDRLRCPI